MSKIQASCLWEHDPDVLSANGTVFNRSCARRLRTSAAFTFPRPQRSLLFSSALLAALPPCAAAQKAPAQRWQHGYVFPCSAAWWCAHRQCASLPSASVVTGRKTCKHATRHRRLQSLWSLRTPVVAKGSVAHHTLQVVLDLIVALAGALLRDDDHAQEAHCGCDCNDRRLRNDHIRSDRVHRTVNTRLQSVIDAAERCRSKAPAA